MATDTSRRMPLLPTRWIDFFAVLLLSVAIAGGIGLKVWRNAGKPAGDVDIHSLAVAGHLGPGKERTASRYPVMPGYPLLLYALATVDPALSEAFECHADAATCPRRAFHKLFVVQALAAVTTFALAGALAYVLSGSGVVAALSVGLFFLATRTGDYAGLVRPHVLYQLLLVASALLAAVASSRAAIWAGALSGLGSGLTAAFAASLEPYAIAVAPGAAIALLLAERGSGLPRSKRSIVALAILLGAAGGSIWIWALALDLGYDLDNAVTHAGHNLAQRLTVNNLDVVSWLVSLVVPTPVIGPAIEHGLLPASMAQRLGLHTPQSVIYTAHMEFERLVGHDRSPLGAFAILCYQGIVEQPFRYVAGLLPTFLRGFWSAGDIVAVLGALHLSRLFPYTRVEGRQLALSVVVWSSAALLLTNALLNFDFAIYNPLLPFIFAYAIAYVSAGW